MVKNSLPAIIALLAFIVHLPAQKNQEKFINEDLSMELIYQLGPIWIPAGKARYTAKPTMNDGSRNIVLEAYGANYKSYDVLYKYSSYHKCIIDNNYDIVCFERKVDQNGKLFSENYNFNKSRKVVYSNISSNSKSNDLDTIVAEKRIFDFISAFFHLRYKNYKEMAPGQRLVVYILLEKQAYPLTIKYLGFEKLTLPDKTTHNCYKLAIQVIEGSVFKGGEEILAWVSADEKRLPMKIKAEVLVGSVNAYLTKEINNHEICFQQ